MSARHGPLPWTGTAGRTRELGYGQAMREIAFLAADLLDRRHTDPGAQASPLAALEGIRSYAMAASQLTIDPALTLATGWALGDGFRKTYNDLFGSTS